LSLSAVINMAFLLQVVFCGLGLDYGQRYPKPIQEVSREQVRQAAVKYLPPTNYCLSIVRNLQQIELDGL
jgi:predicted Zn-dependent peptidase